MASKGAVVSVKHSERVQDVLRRFEGAREGHRILFGGQLLESHRLLSDYGIQSGDLHLLPLGNISGIATGTPGAWSVDSPPLPHPVVLAAATTAVDTDEHGKACAIKVISSRKCKCPDIRFDTIRLSCESHVYGGGNKRYAGFILYAWRDDNDDVNTEWRLGGTHCKSAYFVIQDTDSPDVKRYIGKAPGVVHGAVYWNVFGKDAEPGRAVGEGFAYVKGKCEWNSGVFNANHDAYHDSRRNISDLAKKCVSGIINDWRENSVIGKTYKVKNLLNDD